MNDVPRTHKTVDGLTWEGLHPDRRFGGASIRNESFITESSPWEDAGGWADKGIVTLGMHQHGQERTRMKAVTKGGDFQHFDLDDLGLSVRMEADDPWGGRIAYGGE